MKMLIKYMTKCMASHVFTVHFPTVSRSFC